MTRYNVTGMSCAACSARVEKAVNGVEGVTSCAVSLLTNSMGVEGTASPEKIIKAVENAGYGASLQGSATPEKEDVLKDTETPVLLKRLVLSVSFLIVLMYFSMGHTMWGWPAPPVFDNLVFLGVFEMLLAIVIMIINGRFFTSGFKSLMHGAPNMDTLVAMGSSASFIYSVAELFIMIIAMGRGDNMTVMKYGMNLYFESAAMIVTLITVGKTLEAKSKGRTTDALKALMKLTPETATLIVDGVESEVPVRDIKAGDLFAVRPGQSIPVDGVIVEGFTSVNESALTGESMPVDKGEEDGVTGGTINLSGYVKCRATRVGQDTTLSRIIQMVSDAAATKAPLARIADRVSGIFVPSVIGIALLTLLIWTMAGKPFGWSVARAISVLVISCPCALGLATPVAIMVGNGVGARNGILYKTASAMEGLGRINTAVLDKTGTVTKGQPVVTDIVPSETMKNAEELLVLAASLENKSEHPLAFAVLQKAGEEHLAVLESRDFEAIPGNGLTAVVDEYKTYGGKLDFVRQYAEPSKAMLEKKEALEAEGKTVLLFARQKGEKSEFCGMIAVADTIKEDSAKAVQELHQMGISVVMLTGDNEKTAQVIGAQASVDRVIANVLPDGKEEVIRSLQKDGKVAMVGDGINDAPALVRADVGLAIGAGADVAIDAADIVIVKNNLSDVSAAVRLSRATITNIHENLFWAFIYNIVCIPLAMGLYGLEMKPMYGAAAMSLSSFFVCMNALRLNLFRLYDGRHDRPLKTGKKKEKKVMTKTLKVEGMMCSHCEARVKKALEAVEGVQSAVADHTKGTAVVTLGSKVSDEALKKAVEDQDYKVLGIETE